MVDEVTSEVNDIDSSNDSFGNVAFEDETVIWQGRPSQWVNFGTYLWWLMVLAVSGLFLIFWNAGIKDDYADIADLIIGYAGVSILIISIICILHAYLSVYYEYTIVTANKILEAKGITTIFRQELFCEISDITDIKSPPAGLLGLFGLSTLRIETNDEDQPVIDIRAIKNRDELIMNLQNLEIIYILINYLK